MPEPRIEAGWRTERVEWGLRFTVDTVIARRGHVEPRPSEENARRCAGPPRPGPVRRGGCAADGGHLHHQTEYARLRTGRDQRRSRDDRD